MRFAIFNIKVKTKDFFINLDYGVFPEKVNNKTTLEHNPKFNITLILHFKISFLLHIPD